MRTSSKIIALIMALVMSITIGGVAATWFFAQDNADVDSTSETIGFAIADYIGSISSLIEAIIEELNTPDSTLNNNMDARFDGNRWNMGEQFYYGSMDPDKDSTDYLLDDINEFSFVIQADVESASELDTCTTMYIYTCDVYLGTGGTTTNILGGLMGENSNGDGNPTIPVGEMVYRVYRTTLTRENNNGTMTDWEIAVDAYGNELHELGYAPLTWYEANREYTAQTDLVPMYDINNWTAGTRGYSADTAVWLYYDNGNTENNYAFSFYADTYLDEKDDYDENNQNVSDSFYFVMEVGGIEYDTGVDNVEGWGIVLGSGIVPTSYSDVSYTYDYTPAGTYTITCSNSSAEITIFTTDVNSPEASGTGSVEFTAAGAGTRYYIRVDSGGETANLSVNKTGD